MHNEILFSRPTKTKHHRNFFYQHVVGRAMFTQKIIRKAQAILVGV